MLLPIISILFGLVLLVWSADRFVFGAASTARQLGMSPLLIGMTVVSLGTSAPEIFVSATAALDGAGSLAVGNAIGSNIANIALVLAITALVSPIPIPKAMMQRELPILLLVTVISGYVLYDLTLNLIDSLVLLGCLLITLYWLFIERGEHPVESLDEQEHQAINQTPMGKALGWLLLGLVLLLVSSKLLVWGAVEIATFFGVSELVIGLTIIAIGTSLPELAASVASALKGHHEIAIGNVVGSNIFNLLAVLPIPGLISQTQVEASAFDRDYFGMLVLTVALAVLLWMQKQSGYFARFPAAILLASYLGYMLWLYYSTQVQ